MDDGTLLLPGPTPVPRAVVAREALAMEDHRGPAFMERFARTRERLRQLFRTEGQVAILPASGTGGLEAAVQNLFLPGERVLSVVAGRFGERFAEVAAQRGLTVDRLEVPWGEGPDPDAVSEALGAHAYRGVLLTHNETSTGVLAPVRELAARARARGVLVVVDAISSFPSVPLPLDEWQVDAAVACSQKGFMTPPGLAIVALGPRALDALPERKPGCSYFDLDPYLAGDLPYTPAVSLVNALTAALDLLEAEGEVARARRHRLLARMARAAGRALGLPPLVDDRWASPTVTALSVPEPLDAEALRRAAAGHGLSIGGGLGKLAGRIVRIGHVGHVGPADLLAGIGRLQLALEELTERPARDGLPAAFEVWREALFADGGEGR
jgi:alanine-glyoxylate transaminase/serine-glyoxylate transaminase/serine-pyruvate transaminase